MKVFDIRGTASVNAPYEFSFADLESALGKVLPGWDIRVEGIEREHVGYESVESKRTQRIPTSNFRVEFSAVAGREEAHDG